MLTKPSSDVSPSSLECCTMSPFWKEAAYFQKASIVNVQPTLWNVRTRLAGDVLILIGYYPLACSEAVRTKLGRPYREASPIRAQLLWPGGSHRYIGCTAITRSPPGILHLSLPDIWAKRLNKTIRDTTKRSKPAKLYRMSVNSSYLGLVSESQVLVNALGLLWNMCAHATPDLVTIDHMAWHKHASHQLSDFIFMPSIQSEPHGILKYCKAP